MTLIPQKESHRNKKESKEQAVRAQTYSSNATEEISPALEMSEANAPARQQASPAEQNYAKDEALIKDFSGDERYRTTELEQGGGPATDLTNKESIDEFKDGFRYKNMEPSPTSPSKTDWGIEIEFDKEKGQRNG